MSYKLQTRDIYGFANSIGAETHRKGDELFFKFCPYCGGDGHDKDTFSINLNSGAFKCFRSSCDKSGHFVQLARDFGYKLEFEDDKPKRYRKLPQTAIEVRDNAVAYMKSRGISEATTRKYKVTTRKDRNNVLVFPFFDEHGVLTCVKYRKTDYSPDKDTCKEWFEKDTKPILFGIAQCTKNHGRLIITEGQIDSLSVADCQIENAVSVPTGQGGRTWVQHCYDFVDGFDEIIVFGDHENGHVTLVDQITASFPAKKIKVVRSEDYLGEKDANAIYCKYGATAIHDCINNAAEIPLKAVKKLSDVKSVNLERLEHIATGIYGLDKIIGGLYMGQVTVITGKRGEGKSTLASQIIANALDQSDPDGNPYSIFVYSGELPDYHFKRWLDLQIAGREHIDEAVNVYGDYTYDLSDNVVDKLNLWYDDRAYIFDNTAVTSELSVGGDKVVRTDKISLLGTIEQAICRFNVKLVLIDNLMTALDVDLSHDLYRAQSDFVNAVKRIAVKYNVAVLLIAHPRKSADGTELNADSVSGSGDITNRVDLVLTYSKNMDSDKDIYQSKIAVVKNRLTGKLTNSIKVLYSQASKRIGCNKVECTRVYSCFKDGFDASESHDMPPF